MKQFLLKWMVVVMTVLAFAVGGSMMFNHPAEKTKATDVLPLSSDMIVTFNGDKATVLYDSVGSQNDAFMFEQMVIQNHIKHVDLYMINPGGNVFLMNEFLDMMDRLHRQGITFTGYCRALAASAAVPIFVSCDRRVMAPHAFIMMHPGSWRSEALTRFVGPVPKCYHHLFQEMETFYARVVSEHSKMAYYEVLAILQRSDSELGQEYFTAEEALARGLCDVVEEFTYHGAEPIKAPSLGLTKEADPDDPGVQKKGPYGY